MQTQKGFTVIELLIVVAISAMLSAMALTYSSVSRNEIALIVEESKLAQVILQAKSLSIATFKGGASTSCGYGVVVNANATPQTYSIFAYSPAGSPPCPAEATVAGGTVRSDDEKQYTSGTWHVPVSQGIKIQGQQSDSLTLVLFYPPDPAILLSSDGKTFQSSGGTLRIHLVTVDGQNTAAVSVNPQGQVSF